MRMNAPQYREIQKSQDCTSSWRRRSGNQAGRFSMTALESIYHKLLEIDEGAKTSQVPLDLALDTLIVP